jgi:polar amino acid transport system substrate-binding protein
MEYIKILVFILCVLISNKLAAEDRDTVIIGAVDYPPYEVENPKEILRGFDFEVTTEIFRRLGIPLEIQFIPWKRAIENSRRGKITGILSCTKRNDFYNSDPISTATNALLFLREFDFQSYPIKTLEDLVKYPNLKIGGVNGYASLKALDELNIPFDISPNDTTAIKKLFGKRIDIFFTTKEFATYSLREFNVLRLTKDIPVSQKLYHVCFSQTWPNTKELRDRFNQVLKTMKLDGSYDLIHAKYR